MTQQRGPPDPRFEEMGRVSLHLNCNWDKGATNRRLR